MQHSLPKSDLLDAMFLPYLQRVVLEPSQQIGHTPGEGRVDAKFVDHIERYALAVGR